MDRDKKVFLCVKSMVNIAKDLEDDYGDFSHMLLFIADTISAREQAREVESYQIHGDGNFHALGTEKEIFEIEEDSCSCTDGSCSIDQYDEEMKIEKEIDEMINTVRKEMSSVSD